MATFGLDSTFSHPIAALDFGSAALLLREVDIHKRLQCALFHDTDCMCLGSIAFGALYESNQPIFLYGHADRLWTMLSTVLYRLCRQYSAGYRSRPTKGTVNGIYDMEMSGRRPQPLQVDYTPYVEIRGTVA